ncbi:MAG: hypothetical protein NT075_07175 [Chloroflexi bacterium]|nr:hypothetical protein [Chloroflexota bacterium]
MGVIDSLSAGYRYLGWRLYLLVIPVLLDLLLWFTPRLSVAPLFEQAARLYADPVLTKGMPSDVIDLIQQGLMRTGQGSNLLEVLVSSSLLHMPSLLVMLGPLSGAVIRNVAEPMTAIGLSLLFGLLGLLIGVIFIDLLAQRLPIGAAPKPVAIGDFIWAVLRHWFKLVLFVLLSVLCVIGLSIPISISATLLMLVSPALGVFMLVSVTGLLFVLYFYMYFVPAGLIMDNLGLRAAIVQSFRLVRANFWSTIGFFLVTYLINIGFVLIFDRLAIYQPFGTLAAILANAYIGTGMALALLIFYRTKLLRASGELVAGGQI